VESGDLLNSVIDHVGAALSRGESVKLSGFGVFSIRHKKERLGRNPMTGKVVPIKERFVVSFKPSEKLKHRVVISHEAEAK